MVITDLARTTARENISRMMSGNLLSFSLKGVYTFTCLIFAGRSHACLGEIRVGIKCVIEACTLCVLYLEEDC